MADKDVYIANANGDFSNLDPITGIPRWTAATQGGRLASISATKLYLRSYNLDLFVIDRATGRMVTDPSETHLRAGLNLRDYDLDIVNRFNDRAIFATSSGLIIALREIGQTLPRPLRDPKLPPFGYIPPEGLRLTPQVPAAGEPGADTAPGAGGEAPAGDKEAAPKEEPGNPTQ